MLGAGSIKPYASSSERSPVRLPQESPSRHWPQRGVPPDGEPSTQSIGCPVGAGWRSLAPSGEGFLRCRVPPARDVNLLSPCDGVLEGGCIAPPAGTHHRSVQVRQSAFWAPHPGLSPLPEVGSSRKVPRLWAQALGLLGPICLSLLLDRVSLSWEVSRTQDAGTKSSLSLKISAWLRCPDPQARLTLGSLRLSFPHHFLLLELAG